MSEPSTDDIDPKTESSVEEVEPKTGPDVARLERIVGRSGAALAIGGLLVGLAVEGEAGLPRWFVMAALGVFALGKLLVLVVGVINRWPAWPAVAVELVAIAGVTMLVTYAGSTTQTVGVGVGIFAMLLAASWLRRRAARRTV